MKEKKVAVVSTIQPETHYTRFLYEGLKNKKINVQLWVDNINENLDYVVKNGDNNILVFWSRGWKFPFQILNKVISKKIDIIHFQHEFNMYGKVLGSLYFMLAVLFCKIAGKKVVITIHAIPSIKEIDMEFIKMMGIDKIFPYPLLAKFLFFMFFGIMWRLSDRIIVHSDYTKSVCVEEYNMKNRVNVIPIGILPVNVINLKKKVKGANKVNMLLDKKYILFFGYIMRRKGLEDLIDALKKCVDSGLGVKLVLAGGFLKKDEKYVSKLKSMVKKLMLSNDIFFTGFINEEEISWLYSKACFCVFPYTRSISSSLPLSLSFGYGKTAIVSDIGTLKGEIKNGIDGIVCKSKDSINLFKAIEKLVKNKTLLSKLERGVVKERKKRSWDKVAESVNKLYQNLNG